jgi:hypothetical protein
MIDVTDAESKNRRNYQRGNVINYLDGDSSSKLHMVTVPPLWLVINLAYTKVVAGMIVLIG